MKFLFTALAGGILLLQVSCNDIMTHKSEELQVSDMALENVSENDKFEYNSTDTSGVVGNLPPTQQAPGGTFQPVNQNWDKKIIKTGVLNLQVTDNKIFNKKLKSQVAAFGGYIASEEQHASDYKIEEVITIRVPVDQFDRAVDALSNDAETIVEKRVSSEDVSASFFDTKARLEAKKNVRQRYLELLKRANKMSDILEVEKEINGIQEEMEAAAGRINYLSHASAYSSIDITFFQVISDAVPGDSPGFITQIKNAFRTGASWSGELILAAIAIWPVWLLFSILWFAFKKLRPAKVKSA